MYADAGAVAVGADVQRESTISISIAAVTAELLKPHVNNVSTNFVL